MVLCKQRIRRLFGNCTAFFSRHRERSEAAFIYFFLASQVEFVVELTYIERADVIIHILFDLLLFYLYSYPSVLSS